MVLVVLDVVASVSSILNNSLLALTDQIDLILWIVFCTRHRNIRECNLLSILHSCTGRRMCDAKATEFMFENFHLLLASCRESSFHLLKTSLWTIEKKSFFLTFIFFKYIIYRRYRRISYYNCVLKVITYGERLKYYLKFHVSVAVFKS